MHTWSYSFVLKSITRNHGIAWIYKLVHPESLLSWYLAACSFGCANRRWFLRRRCPSGSVKWIHGLEGRLVLESLAGDQSMGQTTDRGEYTCVWLPSLVQSEFIRTIDLAAVIPPDRLHVKCYGLGVIVIPGWIAMMTSTACSSIVESAIAIVRSVDKLTYLVHALLLTLRKQHMFHIFHTHMRFICNLWGCAKNWGILVNISIPLYRTNRRSQSWINLI